MEEIIRLALYLGIGFVEMFLITQRTIWITKGKGSKAAFVVFAENFVAFFVFYHIASNLYNNWPIFFAYSFGTSMGTVVTLGKNA